MDEEAERRLRLFVKGMLAILIPLQVLMDEEAERRLRLCIHSLIVVRIRLMVLMDEEAERRLRQSRAGRDTRCRIRPDG